MNFNNFNLNSPFASSPSSYSSPYLSNYNNNNFNESSLNPLIMSHAKDYSNPIKRPIPSTGITSNSTRLQSAKDLDYLNQRKIVSLLESGEERFEKEGLKILTLLSYSEEIEFHLKPKARLLQSLVLLLQSTTKLPLPPSYSSFIDNTPPTPFTPQTLSNEEKFNFNLRHISNLNKRKQTLKIIYNLSFESKNKPIISTEKNLILILLNFAVEYEQEKNDYLLDLIGIFSNIAKYAQFPFDYPNFKLFLRLMIDHLLDENWHLTRIILSFFQKLSQRTENEQIFISIENEFFNNIIGLLCLPQSHQNNIKNEFIIDSNLYEEEIEIYRILQEKSLSILHNLSTYQGPISQRSCQQIGCVEVLISLLDIPDFPDISRRSAIILLNFSSEISNHSFLLPYIEKLLLLAWNSENHSSSILLKLISKLTESQFSSDPSSPSK